MGSVVDRRHQLRFNLIRNKLSRRAAEHRRRSDGGRVGSRTLSAPPEKLGAVALAVPLDDPALVMALVIGVRGGRQLLGV